MLYQLWFTVTFYNCCAKCLTMAQGATFNCAYFELNRDALAFRFIIMRLFNYWLSENEYTILWSLLRGGPCDNVIYITWYILPGYAKHCRVLVAPLLLHITCKCQCTLLHLSHINTIPGVTISPTWAGMAPEGATTTRQPFRDRRSPK